MTLETQQLFIIVYLCSVPISMLGIPYLCRTHMDIAVGELIAMLIVSCIPILNIAILGVKVVEVYNFNFDYVLIRQKKNGKAIQ